MKDFSEIYIEYYPKLMRFACDIITCKEDAENLVHDAFLDLWKINDRLVDINNINAYMFRLVRNRCLDYLKHLVHEKAYEEAALAEYRAGIDSLNKMGDEELIAGELSEIMRSTVDQLPCRCREIFLLSRVEGLRYNEIADRLGVTQNTVSVQMCIALRRLRDVAKRYVG